MARRRPRRPRPARQQPGRRYTVDLYKLPGKGAGLFEAAANSPSLTVCDTGTPGDGGGVSVSDGSGGGDVPVDGGIVIS